MSNHCDQCQALLPSDAAVCAECGRDLAAPTVNAPPRRWERKPFADAALTQLIDVPPGGFPPPARPAIPESSPTPAKPNHSPILRAVCLGLLAGLFVILLLVGITSLKRTPAALPSAVIPHRTGQ